MLNQPETNKLLIKDIYSARQYYESLGFDVWLPSGKGFITKIPNGTEVSYADIRSISDRECEVSIAAGDSSNLALFEIRKDKETERKILDHLSSLGVNKEDIPITWCKNDEITRIYISVLDTPRKGQLFSLSNEIGKGYFIYDKHLHFPVPPSYTSNIQILQIQGGFNNIPEIDFEQLKPVIESPYYLYPYPDVDKVVEILDLYGKGFNREYEESYQKEQAVITRMIKAGFEINEIWYAFVTKMPEHFSKLFNENIDSAYDYFEVSYFKGLDFVMTNLSDVGKDILDTFNWAFSKPWLGKDGQDLFAVFLAHLSISLRSNKLIYGASCRELGELAGVADSTAELATEKLVLQGYLFPKEETIQFTREYEIVLNHTINQTNIYINSIKVMNDCMNMLSHDAFRRIALGKSGFQVYWYLYEQPDTIKNLANRTGREVSTVRRCLRKMSEISDPKNLEKIGMVRKNEEDEWEVNEKINLDRVAITFGSTGEREKQMQRHQLERQEYQKRRSETDYLVVSGRNYLKKQK